MLQTQAPIDIELEKVGWKEINKPEDTKRLENLLKTFFNLELNLQQFLTRNRPKGLGLEIMSRNEKRGYVLFEKSSIGENYAERMKDVVSLYQKHAKINKYFVDSAREIAGFSWELK